MSNVIKAKNLIVESTGNNFTSNEIEIIEKKNIFSREDADILYSETKQAVKEMIDEASERAEKYLFEAQREADKVIEDAHQLSKQIIEKSKKNGYNEGYQAGLIEAGNNAAAGLIEIKNKFVEVEKMKQDWLIENRNNIINLAVNIAEKLITTKLSLEPQIIENIVENIFQSNTIIGDIIIRIHPENYQYILEKINLLKKYVVTGNISVEVDSFINQGDCLIVSANGYIDARLDEKLEQLKSALLKVVEK